MNRLPSDKSFGILLTVVLAVLFYKIQFYLLGTVICGLILSISFFKPTYLRPFNFAWSRFGDILNRLISPVVLFLSFFIILTPIAILIKMMGHRSFSKSGWVSKKKQCRFEKPF